MSPIVVIGASYGGLQPLRTIIMELPTPCAASLFVVMHIGRNPSVLPDLLGRAGRHSVVFGSSGALFQPGRIYVAPPDRHMALEATHIRLNDGPKVHHTRPAIDPLFFSAAQMHGPCVMGIVLSGGDGDGAEGLKAIKKHGGIALVQDPEEAEEPSMPYAAMMADHPDACLPGWEIGQRVAEFCVCLGQDEW